MSARIAVFDCDGTLIDGQASICEAMEEAFAAFDTAPPPRSTIRRVVGLSLPVAMRALLPDAPDEQHRDMAERYKEAFRRARGEGRIDQPLIPGIEEVLDALRSDGWLLGVATGMSDRGLTHCLATHGLSDWFVTLQTADRHPSKPNPAMLEAALFEAAAQPQDAVMIGDTAYDMQMATRAGVRGIGVDWGYHTPEELGASGADFVAETPAHLKEYLLA